jgi:hypothetical protein
MNKALKEFAPYSPPGKEKNGALKRFLNKGAGSARPLARIYITVK